MVAYYVVLVLFFFGSSIYSQDDSLKSDPAENESAFSDTFSMTDTTVIVDKMVITATRTKRRISQTPVSISVITQEEITNSSAKNVDDLLGAENSVQVRRVAGMTEGLPSDIIIRGIPGALSGARILVLVDGVPTNASGTPFLILNLIPLELIKRVEVVRGPHSSLYGANAFGGVINIITKTGIGKLHLNGFMETSYPFSFLHKLVASDSSLQSSLTSGAKETYWRIGGFSDAGNERASFVLMGDFRSIGNYLLRDYAWVSKKDSVWKKSNANHDYYDIRMLGKASFFINDKIDLTLHTRLFNSKLGFGKTKNVKHVLPDSLDIDTKGNKFTAGLDLTFYPTGKFTTKLSGYASRLYGEFFNEFSLTSDSSIGSVFDSKSWDAQCDIRNILRLGRHNIITAGIDLLGNFIHFGPTVNSENQELLPGSYSRKDHILNFGLYFQDELHFFNKRFNIVPSFRFDYHSVFGPQYSPKTGICYILNDHWRFRTSIGRAFRAPTLSELSMPDIQLRPDFAIRANPNLQPEEVIAVDGGIDITPSIDLHLQIGGFFNELTNLIGQGIDLQGASGLNPDSLRVSHFNVNDAYSFGLETEIEWQPWDWLGINTNYVLQGSRDRTTTGIYEIFGRDTKIPLNYIPRHSFSFNVWFKKNIGNHVLSCSFQEYICGRRHYLDWDDVEVHPDYIKTVIEDGVLIVYIAPPLIELDPYYRTDLNFRLTFNNRFWMQMGIQNLFNAEYVENDGNIAPGRFASLKCGLDFQVK